MSGGLNFAWLHQGAVAIGNGAVVDLIGTGLCPAQRIGVQVEGISSATVVFETSIDGSTWYAQDLASVSEMETPVNQTTADGLFVGAVCARYFRARIHAWATGTLVVTAVWS